MQITSESVVRRFLPGMLNMKTIKRKRKAKECIDRSLCPVTKMLNLFGDKWTLLVIRDMICFKKKSFNEFLSSTEGIATNILSDRLKRLEEHGIIKKRPYKKSPVRYEYTLTPRGRDLQPLLEEIARWCNSHI